MPIILQKKLRELPKWSHVLLATLLFVTNFKVLQVSGQITSVQVNVGLEHEFRGPYLDASFLPEMDSPTKLGFSLQKTEGQQLIYMKPTQDQCMSVLYSTFAASSDCSLAPRCGQIIPMLKENHLLSKVTLCFGLPDPLVVVKSQDQERISAPNGWCKFMKLHFASDPSFSIAPFTEYYKHIFFAECDGKFVSFTSLHLEKFIRFTGMDYITPTLHATGDSRYCIPGYPESRVYTADTTRELLDKVMLPVRVPLEYYQQAYKRGLRQRYEQLLPNVTAYFAYKEQAGILQLNHNLTYVECRAARQTANYLPYSISSISHTIGHATLSLLLTLWDFVLDGWFKLLEYAQSQEVEKVIVSIGYTIIPFSGMLGWPFVALYSIAYVAYFKPLFIIASVKWLVILIGLKRKLLPSTGRRAAASW